MIIKTVKKIIIQSNPIYVVNGNSFIPIDEGNADYKALKKWIDDGGVVETDDELGIAKDRKIAECKTYLSSTDWQVIRLVDQSSREKLKEDIAKKRALARSLQDKIRVCATLEELNDINTNFE